MALERSLLRLRKKLTVMGMIGHTHGVSSARKPPTIPARKMYIRELFWAPSSKALSSSITGAHSSLPSVCDIAGAAAAVSALAVSAGAASAVSVAVSWPAFSSGSLACAAAATAGDLPFFTSATCDGGRHISSLQAPYSR